MIADRRGDVDRLDVEWTCRSHRRRIEDDRCRTAGRWLPAARDVVVRAEPQLEFGSSTHQAGAGSRSRHTGPRGRRLGHRPGASHDGRERPAEVDPLRLWPIELDPRDGSAIHAGVRQGVLDDRRAASHGVALGPQNVSGDGSRSRRTRSDDAEDGEQRSRVVESTRPAVVAGPSRHRRVQIGSDLSGIAAARLSPTWPKTDSHADDDGWRHGGCRGVIPRNRFRRDCSQQAPPRSDQSHAGALRPGQAIEAAGSEVAERIGREGQQVVVVEPVDGARRERLLERGGRDVRRRRADGPGRGPERRQPVGPPRQVARQPRDRARRR